VCTGTSGNRQTDSALVSRELVEFWPAPPRKCCFHPRFQPVAAAVLFDLESALVNVLPSGLGQVKIRGVARPITRSFALRGTIYECFCYSFKCRLLLHVCVMCTLRSLE
jgi:hypothetical protein